MKPPDTGHLRTDVFALLNLFFSHFLEMGKDVILGVLGGTTSGYTPSFDLQKEIHESNLKCMSTIMKRAVKRGEARPEIPTIVLTLPIDLLRAEMLISRDAITQEFSEKVVDEIFLPLVRI